MKMYHEGCIRNNNYVGGKVDFYDNVDKDRMSLVEVDNMVKELNKDYERHKINYWFKISHEDDALTKMSSDADVMTMCCCALSIRLVIVYLDHIEPHVAFGEEKNDLCIYDDFFLSQARSSGVVIKTLPDDSRKNQHV